jgi:hypothetical protein
VTPEGKLAIGREPIPASAYTLRVDGLQKLFHTKETNEGKYEVHSKRGHEG